MSDQSFLQQVIEDPMLVRLELPLRRTFYPLGLPLELQTNSRDVLQAASEIWGLFSQTLERRTLRLNLGVSEIGTEPLPQKSNFQAREHMLAMVANSENYAVCDFNQGFAFGWVTEALARDHAILRYRFLTPMAIMMAQHEALAPLHGALIRRNNYGVALCGDSLAGKSTLAYACARAGWTYISDDGTFLVRDRSDLYAVGNPHVISFREDARQLFPELAERLVTTRPNGKIGLEVLTRDLPITIAQGSSIDHLVFLNRHHQGPARLRRHSKDQLEAWCQRHVTFGTDEVQAETTRCHRRLLKAPIWEMTYESLDDAIQCLDQLVDLGV